MTDPGSYQKIPNTNEIVKTSLTKQLSPHRTSIKTSIQTILSTKIKIYNVVSVKNYFVPDKGVYHLYVLNQNRTVTFLSNIEMSHMTNYSASISNKYFR